MYIFEGVHFDRSKEHPHCNTVFSVTPTPAIESRRL
jgi:hypothetical protein